MLENLKKYINEINALEGKDKIEIITRDMKLREDLGLDSMDLAILTAKIEDEYDVDVFEDGIVLTVGEVLNKLEKQKWIFL